MKVRTQIGSMALVAILGFAASAHAEPAKEVDPAVLAACDAAGDLMVKLIQAGDMANAKKLKPTVQKCLSIQKAELSRRTDEVAKSADAMFKEMDRTKSR